MDSESHQRAMRTLNRVGVYVPYDTALFSQATLSAVDEAIAGNIPPVAVKMAIEKDLRVMPQAQWMAFLKHCEKMLEEIGEIEAARCVAYAKILQLGTSCIVDHYISKNRQIRREIKRDIATIEREIDDISIGSLLEQHSLIHVRRGISRSMIRELADPLLKMAIARAKEANKLSQVMVQELECWSVEETAPVVSY